MRFSTSVSIGTALFLSLFGFEAHAQDNRCGSSFECFEVAVDLISEMETQIAALQIQVEALKQDIESNRATSGSPDIIFLGQARSCVETPFLIPEGEVASNFRIVSTTPFVTAIVEDGQWQNNAIQEVSFEVTLSEDEKFWKVYPKTWIGYRNESGSWNCDDQPNANRSVFDVLAIRLAR